MNRINFSYSPWCWSLPLRSQLDWLRSKQELDPRTMPELVRNSGNRFVVRSRSAFTGVSQRAFRAIWFGPGKITSRLVIRGSLSALDNCS